MGKLSFLSDPQIDKLMDWLINPVADNSFDEKAQCESRDIFQAKLDTFYNESQNSLLTAVIGEIGNNSFDHNLGNWRDISGIIFINEKDLVVLADRGQGVRKTLSKILPDIKDDLAAVKIAFTQKISGRSPEQRGNGLKFVASAVQKNNWELYFQSGNGAVHLNKGEMNFLAANNIVNGCVAVIKINRGDNV
ncbi:hypothetical protein HZC34_02730 [Candidatus Saganbacteria bacterium]|nr:hypothetical protein [Candidatus Saganbacteria bacterium]